MRTARDIIALVIASIETDISTAQSNYAYAEGERSRINEEKKLVLKNGMDYFMACATYDNSLGFHSGCAFENRERIEALRSRLNFYKSLDAKCAEEEKLEEVKEDEDD